MHQNCTTDETSGSTRGILPGVTPFLLLRLLFRDVATAIFLLGVGTLLVVTLLLLLLLSVTTLLSIPSLALVARTGVLICALAVLLVYEDPPALVCYPLSVPRWGDRRGRALWLTVLLLTVLLLTILLLTILLLAVLLLTILLLLAVLLLLLPAMAVACELVYDAVKEAHCEYVKLRVGV